MTEEEKLKMEKEAVKAQIKRMTQRYAHLEDSSVRHATEQVAKQISLTGTVG